MRRPDAEFRREIALLRACRSADIVQFQGVVLQPEGGLMLVTEYLVRPGGLLGSS